MHQVYTHTSVITQHSISRHTIVGRFVIIAAYVDVKYTVTRWLDRMLASGLTSAADYMSLEPLFKSNWYRETLMCLYLACTKQFLCYFDFGN